MTDKNPQTVSQSCGSFVSTSGALALQRDGLRELAVELSHATGDTQQDRETIGGLQPILRLILPSPLPMAVVWGHDERIYFNDAFAALPGLGSLSFGGIVARGSPLRPWLDGSNTSVDITLPLKGSTDVPSTFWSLHCWTLQEEGQPSRILSLVPQTRRVLAERALTSSEETLATLMDQTPSLLWRCAPGGMPVWMNKRALDYQGPTQGRSNNWALWLEAHDCVALGAAFDDHHEDRQGFAMHLPLRGSDGEYLWHRLRFEPIFNSEGRVSSWVGTGFSVEDWQGGWLASRPPADMVPSRDDLVWTMDANETGLRPIDTRMRPNWAPVLQGQPVTWNEWCAAIRPEERELAMGVPARVRAGEAVHLTMGLASPTDDYSAISLSAFPMVQSDGRGMRIGGLFRPVRHRQEQRAYWVRVGGPEVQDFEQRRMTLLLDQVRLLQFDEAATFIGVARDLQPGAVIFQAPLEPARLFDVLEELGMTTRGVPWMVTGTRNYPLETIVRLMRMGAMDVLSASAGPRMITDAIRKAVSGVRHDKAALEAQGGDPTGARERFAALSKRERQVLDGLAEGGTNKSIALKLKLSPRTVESHRAHLMDRLGAKSLAELLRLASEAGALR